MDARRPANGPTGGRGSRGWTSIASNAGSVDLITAEPRAAASRAGAKAEHARAPRSRPFMICSAPSRMGLGRRPRDDPDDLADQPFGQGEDRARDRLVRKARSPGQRQGRFETVEKGKIVFAMTPARHRRQREAARHLVGQMDVVIDGGFANSAGEMSYSRPRRRSAAKIASTSRRRPLKKIMELVEDEDTGAQAAQDLIELPSLGQRIRALVSRRLEGREDGVVEIEQARALARLTRPKPSGLRPWRASPSDLSTRSVRRSCSCR